MSFKLTYATMFDPPEELHTIFEESLSKAKAGLGQSYGMIINGEEHFAKREFKSTNPASTDEILGYFQTGWCG